MWDIIKDGWNDFWNGIFSPWIDWIVHAIFSVEGGFAEFLTFGNKDFILISQIYKYLAPVGVGMLIIYFLININKTLVSQGTEFTVNSLYAPFLRFLFGYALIGYGTDIINIILGINNSLINATQHILSTKGERKDYSDTVVEAITDDVGGMGLIVVILLLVVLLLQVLACLVIMYHSVSRKIEMIIRVGIAPIALGEAFNGEQSNAYRYIKKLMALAFSGMLMILVVSVGTQLEIAYLTGLFSGNWNASENLMGLFGIVLFPLAEAGMMTVAKQVSNDAFGV